VTSSRCLVDQLSQSQSLDTSSVQITVCVSKHTAAVVYVLCLDSLFLGGRRLHIMSLQTDSQAEALQHFTERFSAEVDGDNGDVAQGQVQALLGQPNFAPQWSLCCP